jgi:hypothetical protein
MPLAGHQQIAEIVPAKAAEEWLKDFAEVLRHELKPSFHRNPW